MGELKAAALLMIGIFIGSGVTVWGLSDTSSLPEKNQVANWTMAKVEQLDRNKRYVLNQRIGSISDSRFPSMYRVEVVREVRTFEGVKNRSLTLYASKDGKFFLEPNKVRFQKSYFDSNALSGEVKAK